MWSQHTGSSAHRRARVAPRGRIKKFVAKSNIEMRRSTVTDKRIAFFAMFFRIQLHCLFPSGLTLNWPVD
jgi:hypothetical protein